MEELRRLEQVQKIMTTMKSHGISDHSCPDSDRFLADFILLLIQPCGKLDTVRKFQLISEHFSKIFAAFREEPLQCLCSEESQSVAGYNQFAKSPQLLCEVKACFGSSQDHFEDMAMIRLDSMRRANSTLHDFCCSYFMFHDMDAKSPESVFRHLPLLSFSESFIYQLDSLNEKLVQFPNGETVDAESRFCWGEDRNWICNFLKNFTTDPFRPLAVLLDRQGLLTERIKEEFKCGEEYWALERRLCCALAHKNEIFIEDVMRAIHLKSFDYRVLNLLLYQLRGEKVNEMHMEFLSVSEFLVEVSDDLFDYEDDMLENNFNVLRMFVKIYGASCAPTMLAKIITEAEEKYGRLLRSLDPKLSANYQKRCEEATKEGGKIIGPPLGTWSIPPVIEDEEFYRAKFNCTEPQI